MKMISLLWALVGLLAFSAFANEPSTLFTGDIQYFCSGPKISDSYLINFRHKLKKGGEFEDEYQVLSIGPQTPKGPTNFAAYRASPEVSKDQSFFVLTFTEQGSAVAINLKNPDNSELRIPNQGILFRTIMHCKTGQVELMVK